MTERKWPGHKRTFLANFIKIKNFANVNNLSSVCPTAVINMVRQILVKKIFDKKMVQKKNNSVRINSVKTIR